MSDMFCLVLFINLLAATVMLDELYWRMRRKRLERRALRNLHQRVLTDQRATNRLIHDLDVQDLQHRLEEDMEVAMLESWWEAS